MPECCFIAELQRLVLALVLRFECGFGCFLLGFGGRVVAWKEGRGGGGGVDRGGRGCGFCGCVFRVDGVGGCGCVGLHGLCHG